MNVQHTSDERDVIDTAKTRLARFVELLRAVEHARRCDDYFGDECLEIDDVIFYMDEDIAAIAETLRAADKRGHQPDSEEPQPLAVKQKARTGGVR